MALYIVVKTGENAGLFFEVKANLKFGRKNSDFILEDSSASSQHAQIKQISENTFILVDLKSKNGIKINGLKEFEVLLTPGLHFTLGHTMFEVIEMSPNQAPQPPPPPIIENVDPPPPTPPDLPINKGLPLPDSQMTASANESTLLTKLIPNLQSPSLPTRQHQKIEKPKTFSSTKPSAATLSQPKESKEPTESKDLPINFDGSKLIDIVVNERWHEALESFSNTVLPQIKNSPRRVAPFNPGLRLLFLRGVQVQTEWILGYGPRTVGAEEYDLTIFEPSAPARCFQLLPTNFGVNFKTSHPDIVLYNGQHQKEVLIKLGDQITIGNTLIRIEFIE